MKIYRHGLFNSGLTVPATHFTGQASDTLTGTLLAKTNVTVTASTQIYYIEADVISVSNVIHVGMYSSTLTSAWVVWGSGGSGATYNGWASRNFPFAAGDTLMIGVSNVNINSVAVYGGKNGSWYSNYGGMIYNQYYGNGFTAGAKFGINLGSSGDKITARFSNFKYSIPSGWVAYPTS